MIFFFAIHKLLEGDAARGRVSTRRPARHQRTKSNENAQLAVAAFYERRPAVIDRRYKGQIGPLPYFALNSAESCVSPQ